MIQPCPINTGTPPLRARERLIVSARLRRIDQSFAQGKSDQFRGGMRPGLAHHAGAVPIDSLDADTQNRGDFLVRPAGNDKVENLSFAVGQGFKGRTVFQHCRKAAANDPSALEDIGERFSHFLQIVRLAEHTIGADIDEFGNLAARFDAGENHYLCLGRPAPGLQQDLGSASMRHRNIEHQHIGPMLADGSDRVDTVFNLGDNLDPVSGERILIGESQRDSVADNRVVICDNSRIGLSKTHAFSPPVAKPNFYSIAIGMGEKRFFRLALAVLLLWLAAFPSGAAHAFDGQVLLETGKSAEQVEYAARYLVQPHGEEISVDQAFAAYREGRFVSTMATESDGAFHDWRTWIALPFRNGGEVGGKTLRRVIGLGGIFVVPPRVYLKCNGEPRREILATKTGAGGSLESRYFTYIRTQNFAIAPGQQCLALINAASDDNPNIGIFREGELGKNQVLAVLFKAGFTVILVMIGIILAVVSFLTNRPLAMLIGIGYAVMMLQNEASLYSTALAATPEQGRSIWEAFTLLAVFFGYYVFLYAFRTDFRLDRNIWFRIAAVALPLPLIWIAYISNSTPDLLWSLYVVLFLFAITVAFRFDIAPRLRLLAGGILLFSAIAALFVEPYYLGRLFTDLAIEFIRDAIRLFAGAGMLLLVLVDVIRTRRERDRMTAERIAALEIQADTDRRLLQAEREYARAREAATRRKAQLAAASHDIRQPIVGLRSILAKERGSLPPGLHSQFDQAIDYLERLTKEYTVDGGAAPADRAEEMETYSLDLITRAVDEMFGAEAERAGVALVITGSDAKTRVPALALIRATSNLVANALRHAEARTISLEIREGEHCKIIVRDDGIGMDTATLKYVQKSGKKGETSDGEGLGLAIVRDLSDRHGCRFTMTSRPGEGTTAVLRLPT